MGYGVHGQSREYKPFIAHLVGDIHVHPSQWHYVPTKVNHGTRELTVDKLANTSQWWNAPDFMKRSEDEWPECNFEVQASEESLKSKKGEKKLQERRLVAMKSLYEVNRMLRKEFGI